jgi:cobalt/nickel transport system permease protein
LELGAALHLPDGFLNLPTAAGCAAAAALAVRSAARGAAIDLEDRAAPFVGVTAAGVFAVQMVNFPLPGGFSGHVVGGVLAARLLGPWAGLAAMTCVLIVQCLFFADGGLLALGANLLNMGVVPCLLGWPIWRSISRFAVGPAGDAFAVASAAWLCTLVSAGCCAVELAASGAVPLRPTLQLLVPVHAVIGVLEAVVTALVVAALTKRRVELLERPSPRASVRTFVFGGAAVAVALATLAAPFSSELPDGLEFAAERLGFAGRSAAAFFASPFADYAAFGISPILGTALAGLLGVVFCSGVGFLLGRWSQRLRGDLAATSPGGANG